jgi:CBS domain-containing protein
MIVSEIMTNNPIRAEVPGTRTDVLKLLVRENITGVPVVKHGERTLVGFVTRQDLFSRPEEEQLAMLMKRDYPSIGPEADVKTAARQLIEMCAAHLPVVEDGKLVGIVTPSDLLIVVEKNNDMTPVISIERSPCVPIFEGSPLSVALVAFKVANVNALPVLDENARLTGIITDRDIFNQSVVDASVVMSDLGLTNNAEDISWGGLSNVMKLWYEVSKIELPNISVREVMVRNPTTAFSKTPASEAARIMRKNDFGQLPLRGPNDNLIGMIYDRDVITTILR